MGVERNALLSSGCLRYGHGDTENGVRSELGLVLRAIKLVDELVDGGLVLDIEICFNELWCDDLVHVVHGFGNAYGGVR